MPEDKWAYWHALSLIDDWGCDRFAELAANLHNSLMLAVAKKGGTVESKDIRKPSDYQRKFRWEQKRKRIMSGREQVELLKNLCGL